MRCPADDSLVVSWQRCARARRAGIGRTGLAILALAALACPSAAVAQRAPSGRPSDFVMTRERQETRPSEAAARGAFDRLRALEGEWAGRSTDDDSGSILFDDARFEYRVTGSGTALMELANAGTPDEMLSIFYMDGDRLVLQHYCSAGNQPRMELIRADSDVLLFDLVGGDNFDPAADGHIHRVRFVLGADAPMESYWSWFEGDREDHTARRVLHERAG